jgi:hypothetical protein
VIKTLLTRIRNNGITFYNERRRYDIEHPRRQSMKSQKRNELNKRRERERERIHINK